MGGTLSYLAKANQLLATFYTIRDIETSITKEYSSTRFVDR